jgi:predicted dehydrogenase
MRPVGIALVGAGPWGRTLGRAFAQVTGTELRWICELDQERRTLAGEAHVGAQLAPDLEEALADPDVAAVAVAASPARHADLGLQVLEANRHLYLEKPMALTTASATALLSAAAHRNRVLVVGHQLLFHPAVRRAREVIASGAIGDTLYLSSTRETIGPPRAAGSAWWTLAPHDISVALQLLGRVPTTVSATGGAYAAPELDGIASATLGFSDGRTARVHVARFAAAKTRRLSVAGTRATLIFDELDGEAPLRILERGADAPKPIPVGEVDPLKAQCDHFVSCIRRDAPESEHGEQALSVVRVLEAGAQSMRAGGAPVGLP